MKILTYLGLLHQLLSCNSARIEALLVGHNINLFEELSVCKLTRRSNHKILMFNLKIEDAKLSKLMW